MALQLEGWSKEVDRTTPKKMREFARADDETTALKKQVADLQKQLAKLSQQVAKSAPSAQQQPTGTSARPTGWTVAQRDLAMLFGIVHVHRRRPRRYR